MKTKNNLQVAPIAIEVYARGMESVLKLVASDIKNSYSNEDDLLDQYETLKEATAFGIAMIQSYVDSSTQFPTNKNFRKNSPIDEEE